MVAQMKNTARMAVRLSLPMLSSAGSGAAGFCVVLFLLAPPPLRAIHDGFWGCYIWRYASVYAPCLRRYDFVMSLAVVARQAARPDMEALNAWLKEEQSVRLQLPIAQPLSPGPGARLSAAIAAAFSVAYLLPPRTPLRPALRPAGSLESVMPVSST